LEKRYVMAIDQGTTGTRVILFDHEGDVHSSSYRGAAYLAGLGTGFWRDEDELSRQWKLERTFEPVFSADKRESLYAGWQEAVKRALRWEHPKAGA